MLRSIIFAVAVGVLALVIAQKQVAASDIIESPPRLSAQYAWTDDANSFPARLYMGFAALVDSERQVADQRTGLLRLGTGYLLEDGPTQFMCRSKVGLPSIDLSTGTRVEPTKTAYRCDINLQSQQLEWNASRVSAQAILFETMEELLARSGGFEDTNPSLLITDGIRTLRLADPQSASTLICQRRPLTPASDHNEYRCMVTFVP